MKDEAQSVLNGWENNCIIIISRISSKYEPEEMFVYVPTNLTELNNIAIQYMFASSFQTSFPGGEYLDASQLNPNAINFTSYSVLPISTPPLPSAKTGLVTLKTETSESNERPLEKQVPQRTTLFRKESFKKCQGLLGREIKLDFRIQWNNQNRNIVPNLVNQMMSFLFKKSKSGRLINRLFSLYPHPANWNATKFYQYMRKIRDSVCHYVNESIIRHFFQIHEPKCQIYDEAEQEFYMKLCRIVALTFLRNDSIIVSLTSARMGKSKRVSHLIAREAVLRKFLEMARE